MKIVLVFFISLIIQLFCARYLPLDEINFQFLLITTIEISLIKGSNCGQIYGFITGFIEDLMFFGVLGSKSLIRTFIGFITGKLQGKYDEGNFVFQFILVFFLLITHSILNQFINLLFLQPFYLNANILLSALMNAFLAPVIYMLLIKLDVS